MVLIRVEFYSRDWGAEYKSFAHSIRRTRLSNLFDAVRGKSGNTATALTLNKGFKLDMTCERNIF